MTLCLIARAVPRCAILASPLISLNTGRRTPMFTLNNVTIRPLATTDLDTWYSWEYDIELGMLAGWTPLLARSAFQQKFEQRINEPKSEMKYFAVDYNDQFTGVLQLAE